MSQASANPFISVPGGVQLVPETLNHAHPGHAKASHDYSRGPRMMYWEMTQACKLACRHCRAEAMSQPHPDQLTPAESLALLHQFAAFETNPHLVLTGGDPLQRPDLFDIIDKAQSLKLNVSITPSATPDLTFDLLKKLKDHNIDSLGLSLDGSSPARHEAVRGIEGCFQWTIQSLRNAAALGMPVQVNTLVAEETIDDLPAIYELLKDIKIMRWSLFFLIGVGRGKVLQPVSPERGEELMNWVYDLTRIAPFIVATTEAPSYRRVALNRMRQMGMKAAEIEQSPMYRGFGIRDGNGILFVSNQGDIYPAGFLPISAGNVKRDNLVDVYQNSPLFRALHTPQMFHGKCGHCEYTMLCGGSRARAFAATEDPLGSDPFCPYQPKAETKTQLEPCIA